MQAANNYEAFGYRFPRFDDLDASERWATERSQGGGVAQSPPAQILARALRR